MSNDIAGSLLVAFIILRLTFSQNTSTTATLRIEKREAPFLPLTYVTGAVANLVCGFGIPVEDLEFETITTGIVFKSQHFLPRTLKDLREYKTTNVNGRKNRNDDNMNFDNIRWVFYKIIATAMNNLGYKGDICVLRAICEAAAFPIHYENGLLGELLHIVLTPKMSTDSYDKQQMAYFKAEKVGRMGKSCAAIYNECEKSLLTQYSLLFR